MCQKRSIEEGEPVCQSVPGAAVDASIGKRLIELMTPVHLEVALAVEQTLHEQLAQADALQRKQLERLRYEAELSRRRYLRVDPDNRLVADALEGDWNDKLRRQHDAEETYDRERQSARRVLEGKQREEIMALARDFPRVWNNERTPQRERKRLVRLLIEDVTLVKGEQLLVHVRFKGGATESLRLERPKPSWELRQTAPEVMRVIDQLLDECTDVQVAAQLNAQGLRSGWGKAFHANMIKRLRHSYGLNSHYERLRESGMLTSKELATRLAVSHWTVATWRRWGLLKARRCTDNGRYLYELPGDDLPAKYAHKKRRSKELTS